MSLIGINKFVRRQTADSEFTHFSGSWEELAALATQHFDNAKPGYREGVCLVPVPASEAARFFTGVVELREGDKMVGEYKARRPGEEPRKTARVVREEGKSPCVSVDIILYRKDVLEESGEDNTGADWDVIAINGYITDEEAPIHPNTLIANHFELDGGTATGMSPEEFEAALRKSVMYWKNKAMLAT